MGQNERQQRAVERILEDERLRGDLEDSAAEALVNWASAQAEAAAADPARPDDAVEAEVQAIRTAARTAARSGETEPRRLIALAEASLAKGASPSTPAPAEKQSAAAPAPAPASPAAQPAAPAPTGSYEQTSDRPAAQPAPPAPTGSYERTNDRPVARPWQRLTRWLKRRRRKR